MNIVPVQKVIPGLIAPFPVLALIVIFLVGDQQPFAFRTNTSHGNDAWGLRYLSRCRPSPKSTE
jgi:hypothetical protein